ncbi:sulfatase [Novipirellula herctigrandis]
MNQPRLHTLPRLAVFAFLFCSTAYAARPNFLFVAIDDLNDFAGYASEEPGNFLQVIYPNADQRRQVASRLTPNLDELASRSAPFLRSYCPSALCGPSRTSLMTGTMPHRTGYYLHDRHFRTYDTLKDVVTLPQYLKQNGYFSTGLGKLFHTSRGTVDGPLENDWADARYSWNRWVNHPTGCNGGQPSKYSPPLGGLLRFGPSRTRLEQSGDWLAADFAARLLENGTAETIGINSNRKEHAQSVSLPTDRPFFLGCGLFRPHLPFFAPKAYFKKFPVNEMSGLNADTLQAIITDLDDVTGDARRFSDINNGKMKVLIENAVRVSGDNDESKVAAWREIVQSYLACVSFADDCVGRIVEGLDASPYRDNTILVLWSDHGYHLGAKYHLAKQALWEEANRTVLMIRDPRNASSCDGQPRRQIVSLRDLYPTICTLAELDVPSKVAGTSLVPLLKDSAASEVNQTVLMTYQQGNHSIRTPTHRFSRYRDGATELYDMIGDPAQRYNLVKSSPELASKLRADLERQVEDEIAESTSRAARAN